MKKIYRGKTSVASKEELDSTIKELVVNKEKIRDILLKLANRKF